jgi:hypothetical protein
VSTVGYTYNGARMCGDCARALGITKSHEHGDTTAWSDCSTAEDTLSAWARAIGLNRDDENSFGDSQFPKRVARGQAQRGRAAGADMRCDCGRNLTHVL